MAHWETSGLLKLFMNEADSPTFAALAASGSAPVTAFIGRHEARAAFLRRESEGALPAGEADLLYQDLLTDIANGDIVEVPLTPALEVEYGKVLQQCLMHSPPVFVRRTTRSTSLQLGSWENLSWFPLILVSVQRQFIWDSRCFHK